MSNLQETRRNNIGECATCGLLSLVLVDIGIVDTNLSYDKTGWFAFVSMEDGEVFVFIDQYHGDTSVPEDEEAKRTHINSELCQQLSTQILEKLPSISVGICPECGDSCDVLSANADVRNFNKTEHHDYNASRQRLPKEKRKLGPTLRKLLGQDE